MLYLSLQNLSKTENSCFQIPQLCQPVNDKEYLLELNVADVRGDANTPRAANVSLRSFLSMNPSLFWSMMVKA